jgi:hypothetical protein
MLIRRLNTEGIRAFRLFLSTARSNPNEEVPFSVLTDPQFSDSMPVSIEINPIGFTYRREAAVYLQQLLAPIPQDVVVRDAGLWTWLSIFFFHSISPSSQGVRLIRNDYSYIFEPLNPRHFYRHLLFCAWNVIRLAPEHNHLFLQGRLSVLDKVTSEVMKRLYLLRIPCIFEVLERIYWDPQCGRARPGITSSVVRAGDLTRRFPTRIRQLEKTYDLAVLTADQLIELLGTEFEFSHLNRD